MVHIRTLKPDRSVGGWIIPLAMLAIFGLSMLVLGYRGSLYVLAGLILLYAMYSLYIFFRTGNWEHLVVCAYQIFLAGLTFMLNTQASRGGVESVEFKVIFIIGFVFFGVLLLFLVFTRRIKWRGSEIFELAAETVEEGGNGYTSRPRPIGKVDLSEMEILAFARYCARHLMAATSIHPSRVTFAPVKMGSEYTFLFRSGSALLDSTWIAFDFDGKVSVHISQKDYLAYKEPLSFDKLCDSLGKLFIDFAELHKRGEGERIIDRLDALQLSPLG
jgi:hypothetical protein